MLSPHPLIRRTRWALVGLLAAFALVGCGGAAASTASGCDWSGILRQALHNSVKATYPASCYKEAQAHESADIRTYAPWVDTDLALAYHSALARATAQKTGDKVRVQESLPPVSIPLGSKGPVINALRNLAPSDPTAVPMPVIVLGGLTVLLLIGGASSLVVRRRMARPPRG